MPSCAPRSSRTAESRTWSSPISAWASACGRATGMLVRSSRPGSSSRPPRIERSTGPGRHDFEIVADAGISLEQDMERRDFTINAIARRLETGEVLDPLGGRADLERGVLRTTSPTSFRDDPLRIVRGLRFVSQLGFDPDEDTLRQMREWAPQLEHVSGERIGGGLTADGMGELSKLLLGAHPAKALRLARDAGVLLHLLPEFEPAIGYAQQSDRQHLTLDEHVFAVVQAGADAGVPLEVRLATLLHDLGKPEAEREGGDHAAIGAAVAARALSRLRYPTKLRAYVVRLVREHPFAPEGEPSPVDARRFLARHGERLALDLLAHRAADLAGKTVPESRVGLARALPDAGRAGARAAASARRPGRRRCRSDRGRLLRGAGARPGAARRCSPRSSRTRSETAASTCSVAPGSSRDPLAPAWPVRGRFLDARRGRQRRALRVVEPRTDDRRRRSSGSTRTVAASARRSARTPTGSRSTGRSTRASSTAPSRVRAASPATGSGRKSSICPCSR